MNVEAKRDAALGDLRAFDGVLVAFSGGVDSAVVAALAEEALGERAVACTAKSETLPAAELEDATRVAEEIGIRHEVVSFSELDSAAFAENDDDRCYHCRSMRLGKMFETARELGIETVCDGTNASDPGEGHRPRPPGRRGARRLLAASGAGIGKSEVREIAREYGLSVADKPSMACLSSRIPTGLEVTEERLNRVEKAETLLRTWGFEQFRVRDHDGLARIEVGADELDRALDPDFAAAVRTHLSDVGFEHVTLDLEGYRTGSVSPAETDGPTEGTGDSAEAADGSPETDSLLDTEYPTLDG